MVLFLIVFCLFFAPKHGGYAPVGAWGVGGMGGAGWGPISRGNVPFWIFQTGIPNFIRSATPASKGVRRIQKAPPISPIPFREARKTAKLPKAPDIFWLGPRISHAPLDLH